MALCKARFTFVKPKEKPQTEVCQQTLLESTKLYTNQLLKKIIKYKAS